jgi:hypothetical protein
LFSGAGFAFGVFGLQQSPSHSACQGQHHTRNDEHTGSALKYHEVLSMRTPLNQARAKPADRNGKKGFLEGGKPEIANICKVIKSRVFT